MNIIPFVSVGKIHFGMTASEVNAVMNEVPRIIKRSQDSIELIHEYSCCIVNFDSNGHCYCVEFWCDIEVNLYEIYFFKSNYQTVKSQMVKLDPDLLISGTGFTSRKTGVVVYSPVAEEVLDTDIEIISVFSKNGLDEYLK